MALDGGEIHYGARDIADHLHTQFKKGRIAVVNIDVVRGAVAGYVLDKYPSDEEREQLEDAALRKFVEKCA